MDPVPSEQPFDLRRWLIILRARKWAIILTAVLVTALSLVYSYRQTPLYTASARMLIEPEDTAGGFEQEANLETEAQIVASNPVASAVVEQLGQETSTGEVLGGLGVEPVTGGASVLLISYTSTDPEFARDVANAFASGYITFRREQELEARAAEQRSLRERQEKLIQQLRSLNERIETAQNRGQDVEADTLEDRKNNVIVQLGVLQQELERNRGGGDFTPGLIIQAAGVPSAPSSPNHLVNAVLGLMLGMGAGVGVAILRDRLDDRFRGRPDVERSLEVPVLATVPRYQQPRQGVEIRVLQEPRGPASEAYRNLRTGLQFIAAQRQMNTILVTSPSAHEGKSATTANIGVALSQANKNVVLISADLRRPTLESFFGLESSVGLTSWLLGDTEDPGEIIFQHPEIPRLSLIPSGPVPANPAELLTSPRLPELIDRLSSIFDLIIFDSPPALPVADAVIIASHVDGVLLIVDAASTSRTAASHAKEQIERVGGQIIGCVLNAFDPATTPYYYEPYYYSHYYSSAEEAEAEIAEAIDISRASRRRAE